MVSLSYLRGNLDFLSARIHYYSSSSYDTARSTDKVGFSCPVNEENSP